MGGIVAPWIIRPIPNTGPVSGALSALYLEAAFAPPFPVSPGYPSSETRPAAMENGQAIARPAVTAREAEESARNRKKDCRCLPRCGVRGNRFLLNKVSLNLGWSTSFILPT